MVSINGSLGDTYTCKDIYIYIWNPVSRDFGAVDVKISFVICFRTQMDKVGLQEIIPPPIYFGQKFQNNSEIINLF